MESKLLMQGLEDVIAQVGGSEKQARFAASLAMNRATAGAWAALRDDQDRVFDRPTPYTKRALKYTKATPNNLNAAVGYGIAAITDIHGNVSRYADIGANETPAGKYLAPEIFGGSRRVKRFEQALQAAGVMPRGWQSVPGNGARLDAFGNMSSGQIIQILSQVATEMTAGHNRTMSSVARKRIAAQRRAGGRFFVVMPGQRGKLLPGVYQREFMGKNITPVLIYVQSVRYRPRYPFLETARNEMQQRFEVELPGAIRQAMATARRG